ncbi:hypothetical protein D3C76_1166810 [compost metagenome]
MQALGIVEHQQIGQPQGQAIHQQAAVDTGGLTQHPGQFHRFFDQGPFGRTTGAVMGHPLAHFSVQWLAGGDVGHGQGAVDGELFSQATLAGAGAAEDQLEHGCFLEIFGEAT